VRSHSNYAELLSKLGLHREALSHLERVTKLDPDDPTAFNVGLGLYRVGKFEYALAYFRLAAASSGSARKKAASMHGVTLARLGRPGEAIAVYEMALAEYPDDALILRNLARALAQKGDHEAALSRLQSLNAREPDDPQTTYLIGEQYQALGHTDLAAVQFKKVLERMPDDEQARQALAGVTGAAH
jgi:tetratricopeptide (TPR) repeat protein